MSLTVVLELREKGNGITDGFSITLSVVENGCAQIKIPGTLPGICELLKAYDSWSTKFCSLEGQLRSRFNHVQVERVPRNEVRAARREVTENLNRWLNCPEAGFQGVRDHLVGLCRQIRNEELRVIVQSDCESVYKLPWHEWDVLERCRHLEVAVSPIAYERPQRKPKTRKKIRILAVLGNKEGIELRRERSLLKDLPSEFCEVQYLVQKSVKDLSRELSSEKGWDIFFFAGHSWSDGDSGGVLFLNDSETISLTDLKRALRNTIEQGLQLAIFNSCDGLGLAWDLARLNIPNVVFMSEPVPDRIAYEFFAYFLQAFITQDQSLYMAVRSARERLEEVEADFPGASWLPTLQHNPAEPVLTWRTICQQEASQELTPSEYIPNDQKDFYRYYALQMRTAKESIYFTSDGFNMDSSSSAEYSDLMTEAQSAAMRNGVTVYRFQILKTMHLNWIGELKRLKRRFPDTYFVLINPRYEHIENFAVIDPELPESVVETMFADINVENQYSRADVATFRHCNRAASEKFYRRFKAIIEDANTQMLTLPSLDNLYEALFEERCSKLNEWAKSNPGIQSIGEIAFGAEVFDREVLNWFQYKGE
jgi:hypothetical protein